MQNQSLIAKPDVTLIFPDSPFLEDKTMFPPLGIMYLSGFLKKYGLKTQCIDMALCDHPMDVDSDVVGISITTPQRDSAYDLIRLYKSLGKTVVVGGPHATHMAGECIDAGADKVFKGYGDQALFEFLVGYEIGEVGIDDIPFPDRDCLPIHKYVQYIDGRPATPLMTARGCPYNCSFCSKIKLGVEFQSVDRTIDEILYVNDRYGFSAFTIYDDTFMANRKRFFEIADRLSKYDFRFRCFGRSDLITEDVCEALKSMHVVAVGLGVESGSDFILSKNMKRTTRQINTNAIKRLQAVGIEAKAFIIVGLPGESQITINETLEWLEIARPNSIGVSVFQPLPGSAIFNEPDKWGISFKYDGTRLNYRGKNGEYVSSVKLPGFSAKDAVKYHAIIQDYFKVIS